MKLRALALCLALMLLSSACASAPYAKCVEHSEDAGYSVRLPASGECVALQADYEDYLPYISDALVQEAEQKLAEQLAQHADSSNSGYYLTALDGCDGYLCLALEIIVKYPDAEGSGCGVDHEHIYLREPISTEALS